MRNCSAREVRENFSEIINLAAFAKDRIGVTRRGKVVAVIVPIEDFHTIEAQEDFLDRQACEEIMADVESGKETIVAWDLVKTELGL